MLILAQATVERGSTLWNKGNPELCGAMYSMTVSWLVKPRQTYEPKALQLTKFTHPSDEFAISTLFPFSELVH